MHVVHLNLGTSKKIAWDKKTKPGAQKQRSQAWMAVQYRKDHERVIKKHANALAEIHKEEPGWVPLIEF
ncbi:hypothetical protein [Mucilaginibacter sp. UR6-11]|uniref:hypothetical protein n=1 Tax=Mucilaginibacter sp. UR6-11 TaxID=1435644 RepID=UPI001E34556B|nr:hypothetical protein [Mucilaginibacter sp. UR6-11]MCC8426582.1 hypothetical protein [Mucilaginibacter sp. UR6-11]